MLSLCGTAVISLSQAVTEDMTRCHFLPTPSSQQPFHMIMCYKWISTQKFLSTCTLWGSSGRKQRIASSEGWRLSLVLDLQKYFLLSFTAVARLTSSWALALLISPCMTSQYPCSPAGVPASSSKGHTPCFVP